MRLAGPDINFIEASENFGNLESAMEYYANHDNEAEEIARNSYETFARRYLTPAAVSIDLLSNKSCQGVYATNDRRLTMHIGHLLLAPFILELGFCPGV